MRNKNHKARFCYAFAFLRLLLHSKCSTAFPHLLKSKIKLNY